MGDLLKAYDASVEASRAEEQDEALVEAGRRIAAQIDYAVEFGKGQEVTKALYLTPHLVNILKELLATPAARLAAEKNSSEAEGGGTLGKLRAVHGVSK
ncbi:MAG: terminase small subunit [Mycobacteriales bacterium]